jgi:hypothetical protein
VKQLAGFDRRIGLADETGEALASEPFAEDR